MTRTPPHDTNAERDPEFASPPCTCADPRCRCRRCHGTRWVTVSDNYPIHQAPDPDPAVFATLNDDEQRLILAELAVRRTALANTVYPCKDCAADLFWKWQGHHMEPDHDAAGCDECSAAAHRVRPRRRRPATVPERRDLA